MKIRVCVVSHSLVAERQQIFWTHFGLLPGVQLLEIYPARWNNLQRAGGYQVDSYRMFSYQYGRDAERAFKEFKPDIVYIQQEADALVTRQILDWCKKLDSKPKRGLFVWENIREPEIPLGIDFIIAGNKEAAGLHTADLILPQVGVDFDLFYPTGSIYHSQLIFTSRKVPEKGWDLVKKLGVSCTSPNDVDYRDLPNEYNSAKVHIILSQDTPNWKEQFLPYSNVEALACGLRCVVGETSATLEWGTGCPGLTFVPPAKNMEPDIYEKTVKDAVASALTDWDINIDGREWAKRRFSKEVVGERLYRFFNGEA